MGAPRPSPPRRATSREIENGPRDNPLATLSRESASRPSALSTQTKLEDVPKVRREKTWMPDYITDTRLATVLRSGVDGPQDTRPSSLPRFREQSRVSPEVAPINAQVHTPPVRVTEQAACTIELAAALHSDHDGAQDGPPTSLPVIRDECPASPTVAPINVQVHITSLRATEQAARTTGQPPTTLPAPTEPAAPVTPPAPRASSTSSLSSAPNNTKSPSPQPRRLTTHGARRKQFEIS